MAHLACARRGASGVALLAEAQIAWRIWRGAICCGANGNKPPLVATTTFVSFRFVNYQVTYSLYARLSLSLSLINARRLFKGFTLITLEKIQQWNRPSN